MVKSLLENVEIEAFLQDKIIGSLNLPWDAPGGMGLVKVVVAESDYEKANLIVEEYKENLQKNK